MKLIFSAILSLFLSHQAFSSTSENKNFSGAFRVDSCSPSCGQVYVGGGEYAPYFDFSKIRGMRISVVDKTVVDFPTCDGSKDAYEFNIWAFGNGQTGHFMNNNLKGDSLNPWRNVCDGKFAVSGNMASLVSSKINIMLKKISDDKFELAWIDKRWGVSGSFKLTREN